MSFDLYQGQLLIKAFETKEAFLDFVKKSLSGGGLLRQRKFFMVDTITNERAELTEKIEPLNGPTDE